MSVILSSHRHKSRKPLSLHYGNALTMLSSHSRVEAVLEADSSQTDFDKKLFSFNAAGRMQTIKRRAIILIAPTFQPWLQGQEGKVILYRKQRKDGT